MNNLNAETNEYGKKMNHSYSRNVLMFIIATFIGGFVFFGSIPVNGTSTVVFKMLLDTIVGAIGGGMKWILLALTAVNLVTFIIGKYINKKGKLHEYYKVDSHVQGILYAIAAAFTFMYFFKIGPVAIADPGQITTGTIIDFIIPSILIIFPLAGGVIPLFTDYGGIDVVGTMLEPIMRPIFKIPGKSGLDTVASIVGASSMGIFLTATLYKRNVYTAREATIIASCFSIVSVGFAAVMINAVDMMHDFTKIFFAYFIMAYIIAFIMVRIPPLNRKKDVYFDGTLQTEQMRRENSKITKDIFKRAVNNGINKADSSNNMFIAVLKGIKDGALLNPKLIPMIIAVGSLGLIFAEYTPLFDILGKPFVPLLTLLQIPDPAAAAPSILIGFAEVYLPVLLIKGQVLAEGTKFFVTCVALLQILFLSETAISIIVLGIPTNFKQVVILFLERTALAIPIVAIAMHILY